MRCLLDTHAALWYFTGSEKLSKRSKDLIDDAKNRIYVSIVSAWEIAIKRSLGREYIHLCSTAEFLTAIEACRFQLLPLSPSHVVPVETLPNHHRDPFDRLLVATAIAEDLTFLSADENVAKYNVTCMW